MGISSYSHPIRTFSVLRVYIENIYVLVDIAPLKMEAQLCTFKEQSIEWKEENLLIEKFNTPQEIRLIIISDRAYHGLYP